MSENVWGADDSKYLKLPKVGDFPIVYEISNIEKVMEEKSKFNFQKNEMVKLPDGSEVSVKRDQGYRYRLTMKDGKTLDIGSWKPYYAFKNAKVKAGDTVKVSHPKEGEWVVQVMSN